MGYKPRKSSNGRSKLHAVRQHRTSKNRASLSSCIHRPVGGEGLRKVRNYIMKALDFGVESGYIVPMDRSYKMLRVSSDLFGSHRRGTTSKKMKYNDKTYECSKCMGVKERDDEMDDENRSTMRFEDYPVQDARRKQRRKRRRSQSRSRRRRRSRKSRRRRRGGENPEEAGDDDEDDDDEEIDDNTSKKSARTEHTTNDSKTRSKTQDTGKNNVENTDDISDISIDDDDTDEEEDKKKDNTTKS